MKVLHIIPTLGSGGAERMLVDIVQQMSNENIDCEVAVLSKENNFFFNELSELEIPIHFSSSSKIYSIQNIFFIKSIISQNKYNCIHTHLFAPQLFTPLALKLTMVKVPLFTTEHSTHNKRRGNKLLYFVDKWLYNQYCQVIAITNATGANLGNYIPSLKNQITVIENGLNFKRYNDAKPIKRSEISRTLNEDEKLILMVAGMREQKDQETLIRASKLLPDNYTIVFVGDGARMEEVKQYAKNQNATSVKFLGKRADVPSIMKSSDIFILSSKWEGFGLVVVEAAVSGLPVIASNVEGLSDIVRSIGGKLFEPFNEKDLVSKIMELEKETNSHTNISNTKLMELSRYSINTTVTGYLNVYKKFIK